MHLPRKAIAGLYCRRHAMLFELDSNRRPVSDGVACMPPAYSFRLAGTNDLPGCATLTDIPHDECRRRIAHGERCYAVFYRDQPVCVAWVHVGSYYVRGLGYRDGEERVGYLYNLVTHRDHRGKGLYKCVLKTLAESLFAQDVARLQQVVENGNAIPLAVVPALGYRAVHRIAHTRLCGLKITVLYDLSGKTVSRRVLFRSPKGVFRI
jgi:GNAT superfamily N-acetyltransferase